MKKILVLTSLIGTILIISAAAFAATGASMRVTVPFEFYAENQQLPAGEYVFEFKGRFPFSATSSAVLLSRLDGTGAMWIAPMPGGDVLRGTSTQVIFHKYGQKFYLSRIECLDYQTNVRMTKAERELRSQGQKKPALTVVAGK